MSKSAMASFNLPAHITRMDYFSMAHEK